jgi:CheY-like chemotaxis protein
MQFLDPLTHANGKRRILLVDDEPGFTRLVQVNLERTGLYHVREENDAVKALETAAEFKPDLVLLDLVMPRMDGAHVGRLIRGDARLKHTRLLFLTGSITKWEAGKEIGGVPALAKPIGTKELIAAIEAALAAPETRS